MTTLSAVAAVDAQLDRAAVAARAGIKIGSIDGYQRRGAIPKPDGYIGRSPWWFASTIDRWLATRPRRGSEPGHTRNEFQRKHPTQEDTSGTSQHQDRGTRPVRSGTRKSGHRGAATR